MDKGIVYSKIARAILVWIREDYHILSEWTGMLSSFVILADPFSFMSNFICVHVCVCIMVYFIFAVKL